jgi:hypothetical protein
MTPLLISSSVLINLPTKPSLLLSLIQPDALASETSLAFANRIHMISILLAENLLIKIIIVLPILNMSAIVKQRLILK